MTRARPKPAGRRRGRKPMVVKIDDTPENVARAVMGMKRKPAKKKGAKRA